MGFFNKLFTKSIVNNNSDNILGYPTVYSGEYFISAPTGTSPYDILQHNKAFVFACQNKNIPIY